MGLSKDDRKKRLQWRDKSIADLRVEITKLKSEQFNQRFARATGKLENYRELPRSRKQLAVLLTLIREKELGIGPGKEKK